VEGTDGNALMMIGVSGRELIGVGVLGSLVADGGGAGKGFVR